MIKITATKQGETGQKSKTIKDAKFDLTPCPYTLLKDYAQRRGKFFSESEPFFVFADKSPVTQRQVTLVLKSCIKKAGFDETLYTGHGLRVGQTSDLYKIGLSVETIKKMGRWRSNAVYHYLRY